uniref:Uncharacterized protein n=1 Tax=Eutreptiella gymnastica TaxID=73025 RepID=A0A7S1I6Q9_9EUGL
MRPKKRYLRPSSFAASIPPSSCYCLAILQCGSGYPTSREGGKVCHTGHTKSTSAAIGYESRARCASHDTCGSAPAAPPPHTWRRRGGGATGATPHSRPTQRTPHPLDTQPALGEVLASLGTPEAGY